MKYEVLEYLRFSNSPLCYIKTGVVVNGDMGLGFKIKWVSPSTSDTQYKLIYGWRKSTSIQYQINYLPSGAGFVFDYWSTGGRASSGRVDSNFHIYDVVPEETVIAGYLDGVKKGTITKKTDTGLEVYLGGSNINGTYSNRTQCFDCGASWIYDNQGNIIQYLVPVKVNGVGYMYDKVSKQLFGNSGTGTFIMGPATGEIIDTESGMPKISLLRRKLLKFMPKYKPNYLCFTAIDKGTFSYTITSGFTTSQRSYVEYSIDDCNTWTRVNNVNNEAITVTTPEITPGKKVYWKGIGTTSANNNSWSQYGRFSSTGRFNVSGVLASFFYGDNFTENSKTKTNYYAGRLFYACSKLIHSKDLILSPNNNSYVYYDAFSGCTNMLTTPSLSNMGTLYECCYRGMFQNCKSITTLPLLPNTALASQCYYNMFYGCTGITSIPQDYLPATTLKTYCYGGMFQNCTNITTAPDLPATTLVAQCYINMFYGCTKLIYIKMLATNISASQCLNAWVYNINTSNGLFVRNPEATWWVVGQHGIPSGWVLEDGTEQNDDIIVFEDEEAKRVITSRYGGITPNAAYRSHWPIRIRGKVDGEITYRQAAHIASITSAFENNTVVKKFHEFQYFTGINGSGSKWFQNCTSLEEITLPNKNNLYLADNAFHGCRDISVFNNWEKVISLGNYCFESSTGTFMNLVASLDFKNILTLHGRAFMYNTAIKKLYIPNVRTIGNFYAMVNCELIDVGHDNPITFEGSLLFWGWSGTKTTNLVFRCPCYVRTDWSTANIHKNAPNMTFNLFVYQKYYDTYVNDAYWSTVDNIYVIGGEEWVNTFGSSDEWADYPNGQAPNIDLEESQVEYLRPKSNYAFTTSVTPTVNTKMIAKARYATLTNTEIAGTYYPTSQRFHFGCYSNKFYFGVGNTYKQVKNWDTEIHTFELSGDGTAAIDGTTYSIGGTLGTATTTISIFARHGSGSNYSYTTSVEIYNFKIYEGEELIRDYIPYRYRGYACLKNKITGYISFMNPLGNFYVGPDVTEE